MASSRTRRRACRTAALGALAVALAAPTVLGTGRAAAKAVTPPATLAAAVARALAPAVDSGAEVSAAIAAPGPGRLLAGLSPALRLAPGAAWPVVTAAAALWHLGPTRTVQTSVVGPPPRSGAILGSLVLEGGADPLLSRAQLAALAASVARRAKMVTGGVLADGALIAYPEIPAGWPLADAQGDSAPPAAALAVDGDAVTLTVTPAAAAGQAAAVSEEPAGLVPVTGSIATVKASRIGSQAPAFAPAGAAVSVSGAIAVGAPPAVHILYPPDPVHLAAILFRRDLIKDGVTVQGGVATGVPVAGNQTLASVPSPPLSSWLPSLWQVPPGALAPSPAVAENLYRLLCQPTLQAPCPSASDQRVVLHFLAVAGASTDTQVADGSGLALTDSASAQTLAQVLDVSAQHAWGRPLVAALPPLADALAAAPAGARGVFADGGGSLALLAQVPAPDGGGDRVVALLASGLSDTSLATASALAVVDAAAGLPVRVPALGKADAAAQTLPARGDPGLLAALDGAGPGSATAVTAWPVGAHAAVVNENGAALLPATGTVPLFIAAQGLPGASTTTRLTTRLVVDGTLSHATINGSVGLVAGLDPGLSSASIAGLAKDVASLGVRRVTGGVAVDDLALPPAEPVSWPWSWLGDPPAVGGDALSVGDGLYSLAVLPGRRVGATPTVEVVPASTPVGVTDEAQTVSGHTDTLAVWPDPASGRLVLTGSIGLGDRFGTVFLRVAPDPGLAAGDLLLQDLRADGISVAGGVRRAAIPAVAPTMASAPGTSLVALEDGLLASPTPTAAWDAAAVGGGALRGASGLAAADAGLAAAAGLLIRDGHGAPAPILSEPFGVGQDDRISTFGCAAALATLAASAGSLGRLPSLLPVVPTGGAAGSLRAMVGVAQGAGSLAGYFIPKTGRPVAVCISLAAMTRSAGPVLASVADAAAAIAVASVASAGRKAPAGAAAASSP